MTDLVGTCPKVEWLDWLAEGDAAGEPATGQEYGWWTGHSLLRQIKRGDRFYVVAHGKLRGFAPVIRVERGCFSGFLGRQDVAQVRGAGGGGLGCIVRSGGAVACTIAEPIPGFRGLRARWWDRADERPFPDWRTP